VSSPETTGTPDGGPQSGRQVSRRGLLALIGAGAALGAGGASAVAVAGDGPGSARAAAPVPDTVAFHGEHQAGIVTPAQDRLHFAAFDMVSGSRDDLVQMLRGWTAAAAAMTAGRDVGSGAEGAAALPPEDTGEASGLTAAHLTLTFGVGPSLFTDARGRDRLGLAARRPAALADLPAFPGDALDPARSGGDLCVQACADDPQVAVHAIRNLARIGRGTVAVRWSQLGFGRTSSTSDEQVTPRNMMGFKDGTDNLKAQDGAALARHVWTAADDGPGWMTGGSYLVARRIRMRIEPWDSTPRVEQERVMGRQKATGAPLAATDEFAPIDFDGVGADGAKLLDDRSHVRLAHPRSNGGASLLRRGYSFTDGTDGLGRLDAGLFFLAYQRDPRKQFVTIYGNLAGRQGDAMNEYVQHVSSAVFACPPGVRPGEHWAQELFA
jgi:deferrochelatase/peroxidase EfeB